MFFCHWFSVFGRQNSCCKLKCLFPTFVQQDFHTSMQDVACKQILNMRGVTWLLKIPGKFLKTRWPQTNRNLRIFTLIQKNNRHILEIRTNRWVFCLFVCPPPIIANVIYVLLTLYWPIQLKAQKDIYDFLIRG